MSGYEEPRCADDEEFARSGRSLRYFAPVRANPLVPTRAACGDPADREEDAPLAPGHHRRSIEQIEADELGDAYERELAGWG